MEGTDWQSRLCNTLVVCIVSPEIESFEGKNPVHMLF